MNCVKTYKGIRLASQSLFVSVNDAPLKSRPDLQPGTLVDFFECGYLGAGPMLLSLAILADCLGDDKLAVEKCPEFEKNICSKLPADKSWTLTSAYISNALNLG
jgi:hypothetical protein